jgi:hypothetical protein
MSENNTSPASRKWYDSAHASLCVLGKHLHHIGFFAPLEKRVKIKQKVLQYTPVQKLEMLLVGLLAGIKAVSHLATTGRVDRALSSAFGLPGCADQSVLAETLDAATEADVKALQEALTELFDRYSQARRHNFKHGLLLLEVDLSPRPSSKHAEGSTRGSMGRSRSTTGRKLGRVRAADAQETVWETVVSGRPAERLSVLQEAIQAAERLLGLESDDVLTQAKRTRTEIREDARLGQRGSDHLAA